MVASVPDARPHESSGCVNFTYRPRAHSKLIGRYGALLPLFRLVGVPCIAAFRRVKSLLCHHSDRPKLATRSAGYFAGATSLTGVSSALVFFAMFIGGVQEPIDQPGAALLHDPRGLGLLPILENFVISLVAHDILHLRSAPTVKQLRSIVHSSELTVMYLQLGGWRHGHRS